MPTPAALERASIVKPGSGEDFSASVRDRVFFDFDQYVLRVDARAWLDQQADWLRRYGTVRVVITGNTDHRGTRLYNLGLGDRRAKSAKAYLVGLGIAADRIDTVSWGKERPISRGFDEASAAQNRNSHTRVLASDGK